MYPPSALTGDKPVATTGRAIADRAALALISVERARLAIVVTDPSQPDNPIIMANQAFLDMTGYGADEVVGRNCRFLQGPRTDRAAVDAIRMGIAAGGEVLVELVNHRKDGTPFWNELYISPILDDEGQLLYHFASQADVTGRRQAHVLEQAEHRLLKEVDHRAKNALALVQGIVRLSRADDAAAYAQAVQGRVDSLARAHGLLASAGWKDVDLASIVRAELEPFGRQHVKMSGPAIAIAPGQVQPLALVLHELLTNAAGHGALSVPGGRVAIDWSPAADALAIDWVETGGPEPQPAPVTGFGWRMVSGVVRSQLMGQIDFDMAPEGLKAAIRIRRRASSLDRPIDPGVGS